MCSEDDPLAIEMSIPLGETVFRPTITCVLLRDVLKATPVTVAEADSAQFLKCESDRDSMKFDAGKPGHFVFE